MRYENSTDAFEQWQDERDVREQNGEQEKQVEVWMRGKLFTVVNERNEGLEELARVYRKAGHTMMIKKNENNIMWCF